MLGGTAEEQVLPAAAAKTRPGAPSRKHWRRRAWPGPDSVRRAVAGFLGRIGWLGVVRGSPGVVLPLAGGLEPRVGCWIGGRIGPLLPTSSWDLRPGGSRAEVGWPTPLVDLAALRGWAACVACWSCLPSVGAGWLGPCGVLVR
ncbi:hypothetical protein NDU88_001339 [Pleurodeles waltl]|uniref:Uncharacterized protein n=1 Tax=Pleurodeles waltl TaxID=8319 RepID=A0AAV7WM54_PLEWA|nr:hypothetical protein NDU88_001339 [Pleurodeles waltl]